VGEIKWHPLLIVKPKTMSRTDIRRAEKLGGICVVECADPETARFVEPPVHMGGDAMAVAAVSLVRYVLAQSSGSVTITPNQIARWYVDILLKGSSPATSPSVAPVASVKR
jgi:hypothetical protein